MAHWRSVLPAGAMLDVAYEDVVDNLEEQARRLIDYCGLPWDDRCLSFHETAGRSRPPAMFRSASRSIAVRSGAGAVTKRSPAALAELEGCRGEPSAVRKKISG